MPALPLHILTLQPLLRLPHCTASSPFPNLGAGCTGAGEIRCTGYDKLYLGPRLRCNCYIDGRGNTHILCCSSGLRRTWRELDML
ncbi:hypothetical protein EDD16DRAFT_1625295 [Pisolithus croceorrhizus]|nr:hypothetical protein EDD16DRAFT_1625295 [Pisolithus croceorrhizus]